MGAMWALKMQSLYGKAALTLSPEQPVWPPNPLEGGSHRSTFDIFLS